jgi:hypothetical protein
MRRFLSRRSHKSLDLIAWAERSWLGLREVEEQVAIAGLSRVQAQANGWIINVCASGERKSPAMQWAIQDISCDRTTFECRTLMRANITECVDSPIDIQYQYLFVIVDVYDSSRACWEFVCGTYSDDCAQSSTSSSNSFLVMLHEHALLLGIPGSFLKGNKLWELCSIQLR